MANCAGADGGACDWGRLSKSAPHREFRRQLGFKIRSNHCGRGRFFNNYSSQIKVHFRAALVKEIHNFVFLFFGVYHGGIFK